MLPEEGGSFKFEDYHLTVGLPPLVGVSQTADRNRVKDIKHELYDMFQLARQLLP